MKLRFTKTKYSQNSAFTLAEVLLALAILSVALCGILATYVACLDSISTSKNVNLATTASQSLIEQIRATPFTQILNTWDNLTFSVNNMPTNKGIIYIDNTNAELFIVTISVSWRQGNKIIGEDTNLNAVLNAGEDKNGNNMLDSTVELTTRIANR